MPTRISSASPPNGKNRSITSPDAWRKKYDEYIESDRWKKFKAYAIRAANNRCQRCTQDGVILQVHHLRYDRLAEESLSDVQVLCKVCHELEDQVRASRGKRRNDQSRYQGWLVKVHGKEEGDVHLQIQFAQWLLNTRRAREVALVFRHPDLPELVVYE